jgi:hypothetical protein
MKIIWFVLFGTTTALAALLISPVLGQTHSQSITVINSGSSQSNQVRIVNSSSMSTQGNTQQQETALTIRAANLTQPYRLTIETRGATLGGEIKLNGRTIHRLQGSSTAIDLSPHLTRGDHVMEIIGTYTPAQGSVQVSLVGPGTTLTQHLSGQGQLTNRIRLSVR